MSGMINAIEVDQKIEILENGERAPHRDYFREEGTLN